MTRFLVGIDGSEFSLKAAAKAARLLKAGFSLSLFLSGSLKCTYRGYR